MKYHIGIDIGSTAAKTVVWADGSVAKAFTMPTGWSSMETAESIKEHLSVLGISLQEQASVIATGYGRISVPYADRCVTEITCHGKGAWHLMEQDCVVIDVGGQDTKIITVVKGQVSDFLMNDKCSAGTGKFLEVMANRLGVGILELFELGEKGDPLSISSMCTVFAESEVISYIGQGKKREDVAAGVIRSVVNKVKQLGQRHGIKYPCILTGGLSVTPHFAQKLETALGVPVSNLELGRYAGALGAALISAERKGAS